MSAAAAAGTVEAGAAPKPRGKKKLVLLAAPVLLAALGGGAWFMGLVPGSAKAPAATKKAEAPHGPIFFEMPEMVANLNAGARRTVFIKLKVKLELARAEDQAPVTAAMPRLLDLFQTYLRETRPEELRGSAGIYRLREELINRADIAVAPAHINDVLFTEMLVQ